MQRLQRSSCCCSRKFTFFLESSWTRYQVPVSSIYVLGGGSSSFSGGLFESVNAGAELRHIGNSWCHVPPVCLQSPHPHRVEESGRHFLFPSPATGILGFYWTVKMVRAGHMILAANALSCEGCCGDRGRGVTCWFNGDNLKKSWNIRWNLKPTLIKPTAAEVQGFYPD